MFFDSNVIMLYLSHQLEEKEVILVNEMIAIQQAYISCVVVMEVLAFSGYDKSQAYEVEKFLYKSFRIKRVTKKVMLLSSEIVRVKKIETGKRLKLTDAIIGATAILENKSLFTLDKEDFKSVKNLKLI